MAILKVFEDTKVREKVSFEREAPTWRPITSEGVIRWRCRDQCAEQLDLRVSVSFSAFGLYSCIRHKKNCTNCSLSGRGVHRFNRSNRCFLLRLGGFEGTSLQLQMRKKCWCVCCWFKRRGSWFQRDDGVQNGKQV